MFHVDTDSLDAMRRMLLALEDDLQACDRQLRHAMLDIPPDSGRTMNTAATQIRRQRRRCIELSDRTQRLANALRKVITRIEDNEQKLVALVDNANIAEDGRPHHGGHGRPFPVPPIRPPLPPIIPPHSVIPVIQPPSMLPAIYIGYIPPVMLRKIVRFNPFLSAWGDSDSLVGVSAYQGRSLPTSVTGRSLSSYAGLAAHSVLPSLPAYVPSPATVRVVDNAVVRMKASNHQPQVAYPQWLMGASFARPAAYDEDDA